MSSMLGSMTESRYSTQTIANGLYNVGQGLYEVTAALLADIKIIARSSDGVDALFRFVGKSIVLVDVIKRSEEVARPILTSITAARAVFSVSRIIHSVNYIITGEILKDWKENKKATIIATVAAAMARVWFTISWLEKQKLVSLDTLGAIHTTIGSIPVFGRPTAALISRVPDIFYFVESVALAKNSLSEIREEKNIARNRVEFVSSCADVALSTLGIIGVVNPYPIAILAFIGATTSLGAYFLDPANTIPSKS
jgi:hypothetical protein